MWKCSNCKEEIEDRFKHCWNCGHPQTEEQQAEPNEEIQQLNIRLPAVEKAPQPAAEPPKEEKPEIAPEPPKKETPKAADEPLKKEKSEPAVEPSPAEELSSEPSPVKEPRREEIFAFANEFPGEEKSSSKVIKIIPLFLWLAAVIAALWFTNLSYQKREAFNNQILEDAQTLNNQKDQFVFPKNTKREKGNVKGKVLPLNVNNKEVNRLYFYLPDELRPTGPEEVKTILWLDCKSDNVWRYPDDSVGYREKCLAYLVDRDTSKVIQIQDFLGEMPPLTKKTGTGDALGQVLPEEYISYIKTNQLEDERTKDTLATDSPNYYFFSKSELFYSIILLCFLGTIGIGWIVFKLKSAFRKAD